MKTHYRIAQKGEVNCQNCRHSKPRERSLRLECPHQGNYQVAKKSTCDRAEVKG